MAFHFGMLMQFSMLLVLLIVAASSATRRVGAEDRIALLPADRIALPNCQRQCGNLTVPYPFGIGDGCYLTPRFSITCNTTTEPPTAALGTDLPITGIFMEDGEVQLPQYIAHDCYDSQGSFTTRNGPTLRVGPPYIISETKNKFVAIGCDTYAFFIGFEGEQKYTTGCMSICDSNILSSGNVDCSGAGCCETKIPRGLKNQTVRLRSFDNYTSGFHVNRCSYAFVVQEGQFTFTNTSFSVLKDTEELPAILNWHVGNESCLIAAQNSTEFACKGNSTCQDRAPGYICRCVDGYEGNPYLPNGCQDIDECKAVNSCSNGATCANLPGNYFCECPKGYKHDDMNLKICNKLDSNGSKTSLLLIIPLSAGGGLMLLLLGISWIYWGLQRRKFIKLKQKYFRENGGLLLQQELASQGASVDATKIFTAEELEKATNNYHDSRILGEGGYGIVYKGILPDKDKVVAIKKSKVGVPTQKEQFVNELIVLSQINHRNVVRLLGCCLETSTPSLVYEFVPNGTLHEHIHNKNGKGSFTWELRLKVAAETAGALAYLHSSALMQIIHRDVKATNILLDENYTAKVSDFGASKLIPLDQTQLATLVQGTFGYLDPEYFITNQLTEKSDVYSFGVVLVELLTSKMALSFDRPEADRSLASFFVRVMGEDRLTQILDDHIFNGGNIKVVKEVAHLAKRCLRLRGEDRPTMKEVAMELEGMRITAKQPWGHTDSHQEESQYLLGSPSSDVYAVNARGNSSTGPSTAGTTGGYDSMQIQMLMPYDDGR